MEKKEKQLKRRLTRRQVMGALTPFFILRQELRRINRDDSSNTFHSADRFVGQFCNRSAELAHPMSERLMPFASVQQFALSGLAANGMSVCENDRARGQPQRRHLLSVTLRAFCDRAIHVLILAFLVSLVREIATSEHRRHLITARTM